MLFEINNQNWLDRNYALPRKSTLLKFFQALILAVFASVTLPVYSADITETSPDTRYRNAVEQARSGEVYEALTELQALSEQFPQRQDILGDLAVIEGWSGDHAAAISVLEKINRAQAPSYVLEGLGGSARNLENYDLAESLYREANERFPERLEPQIGLALTLADADKLDEATDLISRIHTKHPRRIDVLEAVAYIATAREDHFGALAAYEAILAQEPAHRGALRGKVYTLAWLGAPKLALKFADTHAGLLKPEEREALAADLTAFKIRWGAITADSHSGPTRFAGIDLALADSEEVGVKALDKNTELSDIDRKLALDRIVALRDRFRMQDAIDLYYAMADREEEMPAYTKSAAASAHLYLQQPEQARDLYREAHQAEPDNLNSRIGLFFALAENEEPEAAIKVIDDAVAITPQLIDAWSPATIRENPAYIRVLSAQGLGPLLMNRPHEAEQRLHDLSDRAPFHMDVRTDYASSMRARGWPRKAAEELAWILEIEPDNSGALGERSGALLEMRDYRKAESALTVAQNTAAEDGRVVRAGRLWQVHNMRELIVDGTYGRSNGGPIGTRDHAIDTRLYSSPIDYDYRVFAHAHSAEAKFDTGSGRHNRAGVGVEYRSPLYIATTEIFQNIEEGDPGAAASLAITPDDYWTFAGRFDTSANETPLQARFADVDAWLASGEVVWRAHESRSAAASYTRMEFDDDNRRNIVQTRWTERVIAGSVYKLEVTGGLYASRNSLDNAAYFNPSKDFSPTLEFANEWLQWRHYTDAFRHRFVAAGGSYWQEGFGTGSVYNVRYEQEWTADDQLVLRYGIGRSRHPYDGVQTARNYGYLYLNWRF